MTSEGLTTGIVLLMLLSAFFHASWNAVLKKGEDKFLDFVFAELFFLPVGLLMLFFVPLPEPEAWVYLAMSAGFHAVYMYFLAQTYTSGDLSHAYVLLRGFSPFAIAVGGYFFIDETLSLQEWAGVLTITGGLVFAGWPAKDEKFCFTTFRFIVLTSICIVAYTLIDGVGSRLSGNAVSYFVWFGLLQVPIILLWIPLTRGRSAFAYGIRNWKQSTIIMALCYGSYGIVLWVMTKAPIALVSALRETSIIFAALIGVFVLKEGFARKRLFAAFCVCIGTILIKM